MHLVDVEHGLLGATGVVGGNVPLALGSALAAPAAGRRPVAVVFFGDGAVQGGIFVESVNLATLWRLPAILVCENNGFAEFTPRSAHTVVERVSDVVAPYGLERETVDGNDVVAVRDAFARLPRGGARGRRAVPARVPDAPAARPLRGRSGALPRGAGRRGVAGARPDPAAAAARPRRRGRRDRPRSSRRRATRSRRRSQLRPREPVPAGRPDRRARLRVVTQTTYLEAITTTLAEAMRADPRVLVLGRGRRRGRAVGRDRGARRGVRRRAGAQHADQRGGDLRDRDRRGPVRACGPWSRSCSSTSSRSRSTSSSTRRRRRTSCPAGSCTCRSCCARRAARASAAARSTRRASRPG